MGIQGIRVNMGTKGTMETSEIRGMMGNQGNGGTRKPETSRNELGEFQEI